MFIQKLVIIFYLSDIEKDEPDSYLIYDQVDENIAEEAANILRERLESLIEKELRKQAHDTLREKIELRKKLAKQRKEMNHLKTILRHFKETEI